MASDDLSYGDVLHYMWAAEDLPGEPHHTSAMFIMYGRGRCLVTLPLADSHFNIGLNSPITGKSPLSYRPCTSVCPFNPEYEGVQP